MPRDSPLATLANSKQSFTSRVRKHKQNNQPHHTYVRVHTHTHNFYLQKRPVFHKVWLINNQERVAQGLKKEPFVRKNL